MSRTVRKAADRLAVAMLGSRRETSSDPPLRVHGPQVAVEFVLQRAPGGLYVERDESPTHGARTIQSLFFSDRQHFLRWCDDDPVLREHRLLHARVQRTGLDRWDPDG